MTQDDWLRTHPFLGPLALFHARVDGALAAIESRAPMRAPMRGSDLPNWGLPSWDDYLADHAAGIPLLRSSSAAVELEPAGGARRAIALVLRVLLFGKRSKPGVRSDGHRERTRGQEGDRNRLAGRSAGRYLRRLRCWPHRSWL